MKLTLPKSALVAVVGLALCAPAVLAQQNTPTQTAAQASSAATKSANKPVPYKGTVKSVDASSIVVTTAKGDITLTIDPSTKFAVDKKKAQPSAIVVGQKVSGSYTKDDTGTMVAHSVHGWSK